MTVPRPSLVDLVVDTSAVMAVLLGEHAAQHLVAALQRARGPVISEGTLIELSIVAAARLGAEGPGAARAILDAGRVVSTPVDPLISEKATAAWHRFGRRNHAAALNFGDCFAYATAQHYDAPLLCVGNDFAQTDLVVVDVLAA